MASKPNDLGVMNKYMSSVLFTGVAIIFWAGVNILDIITPSPEVDTVKTIAYLLIMLSGITIIIDVIFVKYKRK